MSETGKTGRLTECWPMKAAVWALTGLWLASMSVFDTNACTSFPLVVGLGLVPLLFLSGMMYGGKIPALTLLAWVSLLIGGYFLIRCLNSYSTVEAWRETVLILFAFVYYMVGIYVAQSRSLTGVTTVVIVALAVSVAAFFIVPHVPFEWTGRPAHGFYGENTKPVTLLIYKNNAGAMLATLGALAACCALWGTFRRFVKAFLWMAAVASLGLSFYCGTRNVCVVVPLLMAGGLVLHIIHRVYCGQKVGRITAFFAVLLVVTVGIGVTEFLSGGDTYNLIMGVDTHLRSYIWGHVCRVAPNAPLWGYGVSSAHWEIIPYYSEWATPSYAHNEYLQAWCDYGVIGIACVVYVLFAHLIVAFRCIASEQVTAVRRALNAMAVLVLVAMAFSAVADFIWHNPAMVAATAFACGVMASPYPHTKEGMFSRRRWRDGAPVVPVRGQGRWGRGAIALSAIALLVCCTWLGSVLYTPWKNQWHYNELFAYGADADASKRHALLAETLAIYPEPSLMDCYYSLPLSELNWEEQEHLLKRALTANPKRLYTVTMLVDILEVQEKYDEAEQVMRDSYVGDGMARTLLTNWPAYYASNLLLWGRQELAAGHQGKALSLLQYGLNMQENSYIGFNLAYRVGDAPWKHGESYKPGASNLVTLCKLDEKLLLSTGVQADDAWMQPRCDGGKPALYQRWGKKNEKERKLNLKQLKLPMEIEKNKP